MKIFSNANNRADPGNSSRKNQKIAQLGKQKVYKIKMGRLAVNGGNQLYGDISVSGAKNAALPLLAAGLMSAGGLA